MVGPQPTADPVARLSSPRAAVLAYLVEQDTVVTVTEVCASSGQHATTVREHLDALVASGLVDREQLPPKGRGRPAIGYRARTGTTLRSTRLYADLVTCMGRHLAAVAEEPAAEARAVGHSLASELGPGHVLEVMEHLGFEHSADGEEPPTVRFTTCPMLAAAKKSREVVCNIHLGMLRELGGEELEIEPFVEGGCRLLRPAE